MRKAYLNITAEEVSKLSQADKNILIKDLRADVDKTDAEIVELLIRRISLSLEIGLIKKSIGLSAYDAHREKEIEKNIKEISGDAVIKRSLKRIYERIIDESRALQGERKK